MSHKLARPHDRPLLSQRFGAARRGSTRGAREEAGGIETRRACAEFIVYFWMAGIMSSCERQKKRKKKRVRSCKLSAFLAPEEGPGMRAPVFGRPKRGSEGNIL